MQHCLRYPSDTRIQDVWGICSHDCALTAARMLGSWFHPKQRRLSERLYGEHIYLKAARHENSHDGQAAQAHPEGPRVELPCGALVGGAGYRQVGQRGICRARITHRCGVGDVVWIDL